MNNLVEQSSRWLQSEACRSGNILERTIAVIACFRKYVVEEKTEICDNTGLSLSTISETPGQILFRRNISMFRAEMVTR